MAPDTLAFPGSFVMLLFLVRSKARKAVSFLQSTLDHTGFKMIQTQTIRLSAVGAWQATYSLFVAGIGPSSAL